MYILLEDGRMVVLIVGAFLLALFLHGMGGFLVVRSVANLFRKQWRAALRAAGGAALCFGLVLVPSGVAAYRLANSLAEHVGAAEKDRFFWHTFLQPEAVLPILIGMFNGVFAVFRKDDRSDLAERRHARARRSTNLRT